MSVTSDDVLLFVKAGDDGKRYGGCPFCQRLFMILLVKSNTYQQQSNNQHPTDLQLLELKQHRQLQFRVATVNFAKPPDVFRKLTLRRVPALVHGETALDNVDEIVQYLDEAFPTSELDYDDGEADQCCLDVFQKFCYNIKDVSKDPSHLETELSKINDLLSTRTSQFLSSDHLSHLDCELLPKLHHIRIAAKALKGYDIPLHLGHLWNYLGHAYKEEQFRQACPADQEIIVHWAEKPETPSLSMEEKAKLAREPPRYSLDVPCGVTKV